MCVVLLPSEWRSYTWVAAEGSIGTSNEDESSLRVQTALLSARLQGHMTKVHETKSDTRLRRVWRTAVDASAVMRVP
jgi:hypothetical protein